MSSAAQHSEFILCQTFFIQICKNLENDCCLFESNIGHILKYLPGRKLPATIKEALTDLVSPLTLSSKALNTRARRVIGTKLESTTELQQQQITVGCTGWDKFKSIKALLCNYYNMLYRAPKSGENKSSVLDTARATIYVMDSFDTLKGALTRAFECMV